MKTALDLRDEKDLADTILAQFRYIARIKVSYQAQLKNLGIQRELSLTNLASFESVRDLVHTVYQTERVMQEAEEQLISLQKLEVKDKVVEAYALVGCAD